MADAIVDVHVLIEGMRRDSAIEAVRELLYRLEHKTMTSTEMMSPGYAGFWATGADHGNYSPITGMRRVLSVLASPTETKE